MPDNSSRWIILVIELNCACLQFTLFRIIQNLYILRFSASDHNEGVLYSFEAL